MVQLIIGSTDISAYITDYGVKAVPVEESQNSFTDKDGKEHKAILGFKTSISVSLRKLPSSTAAALKTTIEGGEFSATYSTPLTATTAFICTNYDARRFCPTQSAELWNISLTLESTDLTGSDGL